MSGWKRKARLTLEEHRELGARLYYMNRWAVHNAVRLANCYPKQSKVARMASKVDRALSELRSVLDDAVYEEHGPSKPRLRLAQIYYPGPAVTEALEDRVVEGVQDWLEANPLMKEVL